MTKQVSLADTTYARLKRSKRPGESFSQRIERALDEEARDPASLADRLPRMQMDPDALLAMIEADREATRAPA